MNLMILLCGSVGGLGLLIVRAGLHGQRLSWSTRPAADSTSLKATAIGAAIGLSAFLLTGWLLVAGASGLAAGLIVAVSGKRGTSRMNEEVAEAVALWTEQLRDTLAAAHGLQQTLLATSVHAPERIAPQVQRLAAKLPYAPVAQSLREFASEVNHSSADFVAAALIAATEHEARDVGALLGHLARCSREEARMHQRIWVGRSRTRAAVRIISMTVIGFVGALFLLNRDYLAPYGMPSGQVVLAGIVGVFTLALLLLHSGSKVQVPERFLAVAS
ncbi:MAG: type II secretion system F family protein [Actinomycetota bacterium]